MLTSVHFVAVRPRAAPPDRPCRLNSRSQQMRGHGTRARDEGSGRRGPEAPRHRAAPRSRAEKDGAATRERTQKAPAHMSTYRSARMYSHACGRIQNAPVHRKRPRRQERHSCECTMQMEEWLDNFSGSTPDPNGHPPQYPYAQGRIGLGATSRPCMALPAHATNLWQGSVPCVRLRIANVAADTTGAGHGKMATTLAMQARLLRGCAIEVSGATPSQLETRFPHGRDKAASSLVGRVHADTDRNCACRTASLMPRDVLQAFSRRRMPADARQAGENAARGHREGIRSRQQLSRQPTSQCHQS